MRRIVQFLAIGILAALLSGGCASPEYDIVILGGTVVDGSGQGAFAADLAVTGGRIVRMGRLKPRHGRRVIEARGRLVVPGFIDMHTHCDNLRDEKRKAGLNYLTQGVTTVVTGSCGSGTHKVEEFFRALESRGIGVNVVHMVGQGRVRSAVLKSDDRKPSPEELERMIALVDKAMEEGAAGMSSGLFYSPGGFADQDEVTALLAPVKARGGIYHTHLRDESDYTIGLLAAVREAIAIGEEAGVPVQISHIKALGRPVWGMAPRVVDVIEDARARGVRVFADQYPYPASSTGLIAAVIPRWAQAGGKLAERLRDPRLLPRIRKEAAANIHRRGGAETLVISSFEKRPEWVGKSLQEIAAELDLSEADAAVELARMGSPGVVSFNQTDEDVEYFMQRDWVMTGSDGSVQLPGPTAPHPRNYGTFPRKIRVYVLEKKLLSMEQAVRAASGLPAEMLGLEDRGRIEEGRVADVTIFDPATIRDRATFDDPHQYSEGVLYVLIGGRVVIEDGRFTGTLAGKPLRSGSRSINSP